MMKQLQLKKHALTAISYMLPVVVTAGLLIAIGNLANGTVIENYDAAYTIPDALVSLGVLGMGLLPRSPIPLPIVQESLLVFLWD